jgi:uncharacterized cysteine cluster protein YcgN (CxxCxxCC family)
MAWDDIPDQCDSCSLHNGFDGSEEEAKMEYKRIKCENKKSCLSEYKQDKEESYVGIC